MARQDFTGTATVDSADDVVVTVKPSADIKGCVTFEVSNSDADGTQALNQFDLQVQPHPGAGWHEVLADAEFDTAGEVAKWSTGTLHTTADGSTGAAGVFIPACYAFRFVAGVAANDTEVTVRGSVY